MSKLVVLRKKGEIVNGRYPTFLEKLLLGIDCIGFCAGNKPEHVADCHMFCFKIKPEPLPGKSK